MTKMTLARPADRVALLGAPEIVPSAVRDVVGRSGENAGRRAPTALARGTDSGPEYLTASAQERPGRAGPDRPPVGSGRDGIGDEHEIRNDLVDVTNSLSIVRKDLGGDVSPTTERYLSLTERKTPKAATLADDLTVFVRPRELKETKTELRDLVQEVVDVEFVDILEDGGQLAEGSEQLAYPRVSGHAGWRTLRLNGSSVEDSVIVGVKDTGGGIDQLVMNHGFLTYFTTRASGTGPGLPIVQRFVQADEDKVTLEVRAIVVVSSAVQGVPA